MSGPTTGSPPSGPGLGAPMSTDARALNYWRQTGTDRLTPKQARRIRHKANHAAVRSGR